MSALKASFAIYDLQIAIFEGPRLKYYLKALALQQTFPVTLKKIFDISTLIQLHKHVTSHIQVKSIRHFTSFLFFLPPHIKFGPPFYKKILFTTPTASPRRHHFWSSGPPCAGEVVQGLYSLNLLYCKELLKVRLSSQ